MKIEAAIVAALKTLPAVTGLVGDRIRVDDAEQELALPFIVIAVNSEEIVGGEPDLEARASLWMATASIESHAVLRSSSRALDESIRTNNTDPGTGMSGIAITTAAGRIEVSVHVARATNHVPPASGQGSGKYVTESVYEMQFQLIQHGHS